MKSYSQVQQDLCVSALFSGSSTGYHGTFLDVGCYHPHNDSNSYALELLGWSGVCIDKEPFNYSERSAEFIQGDACEVLSQDRFSRQVFSYMSLDIDQDTIDAINVILDNQMSFMFATVEHDKYRFGCEFQTLQHIALSKAGYVPMFIDVRPEGNAEMYFEDWWCDAGICNRILGVGVAPSEALRSIKNLRKFFVDPKVGQGMISLVQPGLY